MFYTAILNLQSDWLNVVTMSAYSTHRTQTFLYLNCSTCMCLLNLTVHYWWGSFIDSFCRVHYYASRWRQVTVFVSESLNNSFKQFILRHWFIQEWISTNSLYEWGINSFTQTIHSNRWFIQEQNKWLSVSEHYCKSFSRLIWSKILIYSSQLYIDWRHLILHILFCSTNENI